jgi:hypothetical protein
MNSHIVLFDQKVNYQSDHVSIFFSVIDQTPYPRNFGNLRKVEKPAEKVLGRNLKRNRFQSSKIHIKPLFPVNTKVTLNIPTDSNSKTFEVRLVCLPGFTELGILHQIISKGKTIFIASSGQSIRHTPQCQHSSG